MYAVGVRDHILVAHSLVGAVFGAAQQLHGATYVVDVELERAELTSAGIVVDMADLQGELRRVLDELRYRNLDDHPAFRGAASTTERIAHHIHGELARRLPAAAGAMLSVTLTESPVFWAKYRARVADAGAPPADVPA